MIRLQMLRIQAVRVAKGSIALVASSSLMAITMHTWLWFVFLALFVVALVYWGLNIYVWWLWYRYPNA